MHVRYGHDNDLKNNVEYACAVRTRNDLKNNVEYMQPVADPGFSGGGLLPSPAPSLLLLLLSSILLLFLS